MMGALPSGATGSDGCYAGLAPDVPVVKQEHVSLPDAGEYTSVVVLANVGDAPSCKGGEFFVTGWSGNEFLVPVMQASGRFEDTGRRMPSGYVQIPIWRFV
jgi:hypothetical protein